MLNRLIITFVIIGGLGLLWLGWHYYKGRLVQSIRPTGAAADKPALLYFTADYCSICKFQQAPIVAQLAAQLSDSIAVKKYDVTEHPELASRYKVLTLPTTVVIDSCGQVADINYGFTRQTKLEKQLAKANIVKQGVFNELQHAA